MLTFSNAEVADMNDRSRIYTMGVDPGMASTGYMLCSIARADLKNIPVSKQEFHKLFRVHAAGVARTKPDKSKQMRVCDDRLRRIAYIVGDMVLAVRSYVTLPVLWCVEEFVCRPNHPNTSASLYTYVLYGAVYGAVVGNPSYDDMFVPCRPAETKKFVTGLKTATKEQVYALVEDRLPSVTWPRTRNEHVGDAFAAAVYGTYAQRDLLKMFYLLS